MNPRYRNTGLSDVKVREGQDQPVDGHAERHTAHSTQDSTAGERHLHRGAAPVPYRGAHEDRLGAPAKEVESTIPTMGSAQSARSTSSHSMRMIERCTSTTAARDTETTAAKKSCRLSADGCQPSQPAIRDRRQSDVDHIICGASDL
jgi:hypothetical protein